MALATPLLPRHLVFSTNTAALKSYEQHLKSDADVTVKLFRFSENDELDGDKLTQTLDEDAENSQVWVLLLLTGSASFLWLDSEHNPRNVELCTMLKKRFQQLNFVICPTSPDTQCEWEAHSQQSQRTFGEFLDGNSVTTWDGFDLDADSDSPICSLVFKESKTRNDMARRKPVDWNFYLQLALCAGVLVMLVGQQAAIGKLQTDFATAHAEIKGLAKAVDGIKKAALTEHIYSVTNYKKEDSMGSARNNKATFDLLSQLLAKAKHENTARVQEEKARLFANLVHRLVGLGTAVCNVCGGQ